MGPPFGITHLMTAAEHSLYVGLKFVELSLLSSIERLSRSVWGGCLLGRESPGCGRSLKFRIDSQAGGKRLQGCSGSGGALTIGATDRQGEFRFVAQLTIEGRCPLEFRLHRRQRDSGDPSRCGRDLE